MPWTRGPLCPSCRQKVQPVSGEVRACRCKATLAGIRPDGVLHFSGPEGVELVDVFVPYGTQLRLPL